MYYMVYFLEAYLLERLKIQPTVIQEGWVHLYASAALYTHGTDVLNNFVIGYGCTPWLEWTEYK